MLTGCMCMLNQKDLIEIWFVESLDYPTAHACFLLKSCLRRLVIRLIRCQSLNNTCCIKKRSVSLR